MADTYNLGFGGMNPYTQGAVNSTMQDMANNYNLINRPQQENAMVNSGSFGNSGLQQMRQQDDQNQLKSMGNVAANMQNNAYLGQQQFGLQAQNQLYNQQMGNQQFGLQQNAQDFNQGLASNQNAYNQNMGWANYGLGAQNQAFNQDFQNRNFDANQYWTGQNFDAGQYNTSFNQQQQQLQNYMALMNQANTFGQQDITDGTNVQNAPLDYFNQFNNMANSIGGFGGTSTSTQALPGNQLLGALGGWSLGSSIAKG